MSFKRKQAKESNQDQHCQQNVPLIPKNKEQKLAKTKKVDDKLKERKAKFEEKQKYNFNNSVCDCA